MKHNLLIKIVATTTLVALATTNVFSNPVYSRTSQRGVERLNYNNGSNYSSCYNGGSGRFVDYDLENMTEEEYYTWVDSYTDEYGYCFFSDYSYDEMREYMNDRGSCGGRNRGSRRFY